MRLKRMGMLAAGLAFAGGTAGVGVAVASAQTTHPAHHAAEAVTQSASSGRTSSARRAVTVMPAAAPGYPGFGAAASATAESKSMPKHTCPNMGSSSKAGSSSSSSTTASVNTY